MFSFSRSSTSCYLSISFASLVLNLFFRKQNIHFNGDKGSHAFVGIPPCHQKLPELAFRYNEGCEGENHLCSFSSSVCRPSCIERIEFHHVLVKDSRGSSFPPGEARSLTRLSMPSKRHRMTINSSSSEMRIEFINEEKGRNRNWDVSRSDEQLTTWKLDFHSREHSEENTTFVYWWRQKKISWLKTFLLLYINSKIFGSVDTKNVQKETLRNKTGHSFSHSMWTWREVRQRKKEASTNIWRTHVWHVELQMSGWRWRKDRSMAMFAAFISLLRNYLWLRTHCDEMRWFVRRWNRRCGFLSLVKKKRWFDFGFWRRWFDGRHRRADRWVWPEQNDRIDPDDDRTMSLLVHARMDRQWRCLHQFVFFLDDSKGFSRSLKWSRLRTTPRVGCVFVFNL